ncbi:tyrosine-type recombinase/integrase [Myxococcus xanthus]|uniref:tyrosine-type recombinase/integrase n=1 Tax=Myxococcus xanthus TaxID=34 RepID=UPI0019178707|nr:tyrosine-type recombinase/integrase [Myxococcus xanthus]QQR47796.1 tyrosine-type recombinase/integrase [Myxococcus xanthus]
MSSKQRWPGGYVHQQQDGQPLFIIERRVRGQRFHVSTRCHNLRSAMKQLERFEADPLGYAPEGETTEAPLVMTAKLVSEYHAFQLAKGGTRKHANEMSSRLADWIEDLGGKDLRQVTLRDHIKPALDRRGTGRPHRIIALKGFFGWLRKERHLLTSKDDPTLDLPVPQAVPAKRKKRKAVPFESVTAVASILTEELRDMLTVLAGTGWHVTELERFVRRPESEIVQARRGDTLAVLVTRHKVGDMTRTPVNDPNVLAAAMRLRERGTLPRRANTALKAACVAAGVPAFTFGVMRHSVATWSVEQGAAPPLVSEFLNHKDKRTTQRFYTDVSVPTVQVPLPRLVLVKDETSKKVG